MKNKDLFRTTQFGCLLNKRMPLLGETLDEFEENSVISTYAPEVRPNAPWRTQLFENWVIVSVCAWCSFRCILSREGQVNIYGPGGTPDHTYQIPGAGVFGESASGLGYVNRIRAIGNHLYVCGYSRQVYRFVWDGQDLGSGRWVDIAGPMRQPALDEPPATEAGEAAFDAWLDKSDAAIDFVDIDGTGDHDIYVAGDEVWHWNGRLWQPIALPTDENINALKIFHRDEVWLAGHNGTLLKGNARTGFVDVSTVEDNQNFVGIEAFGGKLYLASNFGLHTYDPRTGKIERYITDLTPDLQDTHVLEAKDGILWSIGFKDLAYFDGKTWTRVDHPDNPPIR